ncbi:hypothetical protein J3B02_004358, partial [Coemansia erecta]
GKPILREGPTGDWLGTFLGHKGAVWSAMLNADTSRAVTASADYTAKIWNACTGEETVSLAHDSIVKSADFANAQGTQVITGGRDKTVRLFDLTKPDSPTLLTKHEAALRTVKYTDHKNLVVSGGEDSQIKLLDMRSSTEVKHLDAGSPISNISLTHDGKLLCCAAGNKVVAWDMEAFKVALDLEMDFPVSVIAVNPQRSRMVIGGKNDLLIRSYEFGQEGKILETHKGHHGPVHDACFSPDGEIYATGSEDGTVRLWQTNPGTAYGLWQLRKI